MEGRGQRVGHRLSPPEVRWRAGVGGGWEENEEFTYYMPQKTTNNILQGSNRTNRHVEAKAFIEAALRLHSTFIILTAIQVYPFGEAKVK